MDQLIQILGALLILAGFTGAQLGRMTTKSAVYLVLNLAGSVILTGVAFVGSDWGFLLLEAVWAVVSAWGLLRILGRDATATD